MTQRRLPRSRTGPQSCWHTSSVTALASRPPHMSTSGLSADLAPLRPPRESHVAVDGLCHSCGSSTAIHSQCLSQSHGPTQAAACTHPGLRTGAGRPTSARTDRDVKSRKGREKPPSCAETIPDANTRADDADTFSLQRGCKIVAHLCGLKSHFQSIAQPTRKRSLNEALAPSRSAQVTLPYRHPPA